MVADQDQDADRAERLASWLGVTTTSVVEFEGVATDAASGVANAAVRTTLDEVVKLLATHRARVAEMAGLVGRGEPGKLREGAGTLKAKADEMVGALLMGGEGTSGWRVLHQLHLAGNESANVLAVAGRLAAAAGFEDAATIARELVAEQRAALDRIFAAILDLAPAAVLDRVDD